VKISTNTPRLNLILFPRVLRFIQPSG